MALDPVNKNHRPLRRIVLNETGQMSIFIALIFQVLFVFFAMVINVGLLVHDKINLQNAVDLGAYYAAQRQAEILNEIAHVNYQIRQDYKLLAWRYRVLGTLGRQGVTNPPTENTKPPARKDNPSVLDPNSPWINPDYGDEPPSVCVSNEMWYEMVQNSDQEENYCFQPYYDKVPKIPSVVQIAPFVPGLGAAASFTALAQDQQRLSCQNAGPRNWAFTMQMLFAYKLAIATRKSIIWELRKNLIDPDMKDRNIQSVREGVLTTVRKNLTRANLDSFEEGAFKVINGLADQNCNRGDEGEFVLPEIRIAPQLLYSAYNCDDGFVMEMNAHEILNLLDPQIIQLYDPDSTFRNLAKGEPEPTQPIHSSLGFEKNPWCMAYMGVKATTKTHKPFAPLGGEIELQARAFAQPFGGRVGPWYRERWTRGGLASSEGDRVDPLTTPRLLGTGSDDPTPIARLPNYSRYPGDTLGLKAQATLGAQNQIIRSFAPPKPKLERLSLRWYQHLLQTPQTGDVLAKNENPSLPLRRAEIAAVTPDLYDVTYYSIDPNYIPNYVTSGPERFTGAEQVYGQPVKQIPDIGGSFPEQGQRMSVETQIASSVQAGGLDQQVLPKLYYVIRTWQHLLTGWVSRKVQTFDFPQEKYAKCEETASEQVMIPGKCTAGGRVGYSVRLISRSHLAFPNWKIGGEGEAEGAILNPPPEGF